MVQGYRTTDQQCYTQDVSGIHQRINPHRLAESRCNGGSFQGAQPGSGHRINLEVSSRFTIRVEVLVYAVYKDLLSEPQHVTGFYGKLPVRIALTHSDNPSADLEFLVGGPAPPVVSADGIDS
jgi:hypothetical protein